MHGTRGFPLGVFAAFVFSVTELEAESADVKSNLHPVHSISPEIRQAVNAKLPKYAPVVAEKPEVSGQIPPANSPDIFYLPKLTVKAAAPTAPTDFAFLTPKGRLDLAMKSYQGLGLGNLFGLNGGVAMDMQAEQRDVDKKAALVDTVERTYCIVSKIARPAVTTPPGEFM